MMRPANTSPPADRGAGRGRLGVTMASPRLADRRQLQRLGQRRPGQRCRVRRVDKSTLSGERFVRKYCHYCSSINVWAVGQDGGGRRGQRTQQGPPHACETAARRTPRAWPHLFAPAVAALRDAFRWHLTIEVSGDESEGQKFKTIREKLRIPGSYNPTVDREFPRIFNFTAFPWPKFRK